MTTIKVFWKLICEIRADGILNEVIVDRKYISELPKCDYHISIFPTKYLFYAQTSAITSTPATLNITMILIKSIMKAWRTLYQVVMLKESPWELILRFTIPLHPQKEFPRIRLIDEDERGKHTFSKGLCNSILKYLKQ